MFCSTLTGGPRTRPRLARAAKAHSARVPTPRQRRVLRRVSEPTTAARAHGVSRAQRGAHWDTKRQSVRVGAGAEAVSLF